MVLEKNHVLSAMEIKPLAEKYLVAAVKEMVITNANYATGLVK
jgi:hypothetical protein